MILDSFLSSVRKTVLPNGLTLLTRFHKGGVVAINTWVKAGYFHEPDEVAGMAHLFEHMFFKGSKNFPGAEEIARHVSMLGGSSNAGTIYDSTNYYFVLPREGFVKGVEIQADAIANPLFDPEELRKEAEVVIEESNRKRDNPGAVALESMFAEAFTAHRMKRWRIGSDEVLRNINRDHLLAFFESLYRPANIIVSIVGDVTHEEALDVVGRTFGTIPRGVLQKERGPVEPPQERFRIAHGTADINQSYVVFGWHTPGIQDEDDEAIEVLSSVLGSGKYSRLYRGVVGPEGASSVSASNFTYEDVGIFTIRAMCDRDKATLVEDGIVRELERMKRFGPNDFEVQLARNRIESGFVFQLEDALGQAQSLAYFESRGAYLDMGDYLTRLERVAPEDVRRVANKYLDLKNLTMFRYDPDGTPAPRPEFVFARLQTAAKDAVSAPATVKPPQTRAAVAESKHERALQRFVLPNGVTLFVREAPGTPTVSTGIYFRGGRLYENSSNAGVTQLMARVMRRGTKSRSAEEIDREIEFLGTQLGIQMEEDYFGFSLDILQKYYRHGVEILADVVLNPTFPSERVVEEKHLQIASIKRALDSSSERPFQLFFENFYGNHPYGLPDAGYLTSVEPMTRETLEGWCRAVVSADNALILVVGDVLAEDVYALMKESFGALKKRSVLPPALLTVQPPQFPREVVESRVRKQTSIVVGVPAVPPTHTDWVTLRVIQDVTSGLAGTFFAELRGKRSLAYTVFAGDSSRQYAGCFVGFIATEASKEQEAREGLITEMRRLAADGVTEEDLERAKSHIAGSMKIRLQTNSALRSELAENYLYGLGLDFTEHFLERVHGVTLEEIRDVAKRYLSGDNYTVAILRGKA